MRDGHSRKDGFRSACENENEAAGSKAEGEKDEERWEVLHSQEKSCLSRRLYEGWCEEVAEDGLGPCESVGTTSRWHFAYRKVRKVEVEEAGGGSSRQQQAAASKKASAAVSFYGGK